MRILFCNYEYPPLGGGGGVVNASLAEELAKTHDVTVLTSQGRGLAAKETVRGVRVLRVPVLFRSQQAAANFPSMFAYMVSGTVRGRALLKKESFDIINTHFALPTGPVGDALSRRTGIPNVLSVHGGDLYDPSKKTSPHRHKILRAWVRKLLYRADAVVGQSENTLGNIRRYFADDIATDCVSLGINRPGPGEVSRRQYGLTDDDIVLVTVGRLVARKAVDQLIEVMARLNQDNAHLLVMGTGPLEAQLKAQAETLGVAGRVHFLGFVSEEEKFGVLRMADLFVTTSQHEGFGLVFLEAMACGLPVICYDFGGQTDFLATGRTGFLIELNEQDAFVAACRELGANPVERKRLGTDNVEQVEAYYIDRCAARYLAIFERVLVSRAE